MLAGNGAAPILAGDGAAPILTGNGAGSAAGITAARGSREQARPGTGRQQAPASRNCDVPVPPADGAAGGLARNPAGAAMVVSPGPAPAVAPSLTGNPVGSASRRRARTTATGRCQIAPTPA